MEKKETMYSSSLQDEGKENGNVTKRKKGKVNQGIIEVSINQLHDFSNHPCKVETDTSLFETINEIK